MHFVRFAPIVIAALACSADSAAGPTDRLAPHRATYELSSVTGSTRSTGHVINGEMKFQVDARCDGIVFRNFVRINFKPPDRQPYQQETLELQWESTDGLHFEFDYQMAIDGLIVDTVLGQAALDEPGGGGTALYFKPDRMTVDLPAGTVFPVSARRRMIAELKGGSDSFSQMIFAGPGKDGMQIEKVSVLAEPLYLGPHVVEGGASLLVGQAWHTQKEIFADVGQTQLRYTANHQTYENGVMIGALVHSDKLNIQTKLVRVEALPRPECK